MSRLLLTLLFALPAVRAAPTSEPPARFHAKAQVARAPAAAARFGLSETTMEPTEVLAKPRFSITTSATTKGGVCASADDIFRNGFEN